MLTYFTASLLVASAALTGGHRLTYTDDSFSDEDAQCDPTFPPLGQAEPVSQQELQQFGAGLLGIQPSAQPPSWQQQQFQQPQGRQFVPRKPRKKSKKALQEVTNRPSSEQYLTASLHQHKQLQRQAANTMAPRATQNSQRSTSPGDDELARVKGQNGELRSENKELVAENKKLSKEVSPLQKRIDELDAKIRQLQTDNNALTQQLAVRGRKKSNKKSKEEGMTEEEVRVTFAHQTAPL